MEKVLPQLDAIIARSAEESLFWGPIRNLPADMPEADKQRITAEYKRMIEFRIMPAYRALRGFIATEYLPACRDTAGLAALPNGAAWYAYDVRQSTTSDLTPAQIHQTGLDEVARLQGEIQNVAKQVKFRGNLPKFYKFMQTDKRFVFRSESELLDAYRGLQSRVQAAVPACSPPRASRPWTCASGATARASGGQRLVHAPQPARQHAGHLLRQYLQPARAPALGRRKPVPARRRAGPSLPTRPSAAIDRPAQVPPLRWRDRLHRRLGPVCRIAGPRTGAVPGPVQLLRLPAERAAALDPAGGGHRPA